MRCGQCIKPNVLLASSMYIRSVNVLLATRVYIKSANVLLECILSLQMYF